MRHKTFLSGTRTLHQVQGSDKAWERRWLMGQSSRQALHKPEQCDVQVYLLKLTCEGNSIIPDMQFLLCYGEQAVTEAFVNSRA